MTTAPESQSQGGSQLGNFAAGLLASSLCAAFLNLGMSAFDHPGAFRFFPALLLPLALTLGIFAGAYLLLWGVATLPLRRLGASSASIAVALGTFSSLLALLWPVAAVLRREVAWKSGLVLLALPWIWREPGVRFAVASCAFFAAALGNSRQSPLE